MKTEAIRMIGVKWTRIMPAVLLMYTISYFDRVNIGLALPSMSRDLNLSPAEAGLAGGIFFWGYLVTFLAGGWLAPRFGPRRVVFYSLLTLGLRRHAERLRPRRERVACGAAVARRG